MLLVGHAFCRSLGRAVVFYYILYFCMVVLFTFSLSRCFFVMERPIYTQQSKNITLLNIVFYVLFCYYLLCLFYCVEKYLRVLLFCSCYVKQCLLGSLGNKMKKYLSFFIYFFQTGCSKFFFNLQVLYMYENFNVSYMEIFVRNI